MMTTASGSAAMAALAVRRTRAMMRGSRGRIDNGPITATSLKRKLRGEPLALHPFAADAEVMNAALALRIQRGHEARSQRVAGVLARD